ncbi:MAG: homoserine dehydrogenase [Bryobacteraceae bacterium]|nr:homoserine dehydrogenase [Bryobacteraceae bacterium]
MRLALLGYGNVARAFAHLLEKKHSAYPFRIVGIHTATRGTAYNPAGLPLEPRFDPAAATVEEFLDRSAAEVVLELTTLNPESGEPAISHIRAAFSRGMHVITANKGPVAFAYRDLIREAKLAGVEFRHEAVTMDGTPVYSLVRNNLPGVKILGFAGTLTSTAQLILQTMREGKSLEQGIEQARSFGLAEADPWFDIDGWDSACKTAALANVLMDAGVTPQDVDRKGIGRMTPDKLAEVESKGKRVVLVSRARRVDGRLKLRVRAEVLDRDDMLAAARGSSTAVLLETDLMGQVAVFSMNPTVEQTAYGVFADLVDIARSL